MKKNRSLIVVMFAFLMTAFFHQKTLGINLFMAESLLLIWLFVTKQLQFKGLYPKTIVIGFSLTSIFTVITHSAFSYVMNFMTLLALIGIMVYPQAKSLVTTFGQALSTFFHAPAKFIYNLFQSRVRGRSIGGMIWRFRIFILPFTVVLLFIAIYRIANPTFDNVFGEIMTVIADGIIYIFTGLDFGLLFTFLFCLWLSIFALKPTLNKAIAESDVLLNDALWRVRRKRWPNLKMMALANENRGGVFLFATLNVLILMLNILDIQSVWFGFEWKGQYLKEFVHVGTYFLIFSIVLSIVLVLYYFRGNQNFYLRNIWLKRLSYAWLIQNSILVISVAIRNYWYVQYFNLAYKRIGVFVFLVLTLYGLYTVFIKVRDTKSPHYIISRNAYVMMVVLIMCSLVNWDGLIAKYNFRNADESFLHLDFMATLSDKTLPYLDVGTKQLRQIETDQDRSFSFGYRYMSSDAYIQKIADRKYSFIRRWKDKSWLEWNWPEHRAYLELTEQP